MEEKWIRDPLSGILFALTGLGYGLFLILAALGAIPWDKWWAYLVLAIGFMLAIEFPIRCLNSRYRMHGLIFTRQLIGITLICIGIGGVVGFGAWWPALVVIMVFWMILMFSMKRFLSPRR